MEKKWKRKFLIKSFIEKIECVLRCYCLQYRPQAMNSRNLQNNNRLLSGAPCHGRYSLTWYYNIHSNFTWQKKHTHTRYIIFEAHIQKHKIPYDRIACPPPYTIKKKKRKKEIFPNYVVRTDIIFRFSLL